MQFESEIKRLQHPEARLIPLFIWNSDSWFRGNLPDYLLPLMQAPSGNLIHQIQAASIQQEDAETAWLAIALSHPDLSAETLVQIGAELNIENARLFAIAVALGRLDVLHYLPKVMPQLFDSMNRMSRASIPTRRQSTDFLTGVLWSTAKNGQLEVLKCLNNLLPGSLFRAIMANDYFIFPQVAANGQIEVLQYLVQYVPNLLQHMIAAYDYQAFRYAAGNGHLDVLQYLEEKAPTSIQSMLRADNYEAFNYAARNNHLNVVRHLLSYPAVFDYAERHVHEYVNPLVTEKIAALREQKNTFAITHPNETFDIENETEANLLFLMARNLTRRGQPALQHDLDFLLTIPTVHHLAITQGFGDAVEQSELDLRALVRDRESSMTALTSGEKARLNDAILRYGHRIEGHEEAILQQLREQLEARYSSHPATLIKNGETIQLPLSWSDFQALGLNEKEQQNAIAAYAQNKDHTAWRFLLKPNPWIHEESYFASVEREPDGTVTSRWSAFEKYRFELCLFYLGAIDEGAQPVKGYTKESLLEEFITALALIQRAHNWDRSRPKLDCTGKPILTARREPVREEYDDLQKDLPSCPAGIIRRLVQSALGNVRFAILTPELVEIELAAFTHQHLPTSISNRLSRKSLTTNSHKLTARGRVS